VADVAIVVDSSGSILATQWTELISFLTRLIQGLNVAPDAINYAVGLWAQTAKKLLPLTGDKSAVTKLDLSAQARTVGSSTNMDQGFMMAGELLAASTRKKAPKFCVMLTDGMPTNRTLAASASTKLKGQGVTVMMILIGGSVSVADVRDYVSVPSILVSHFSALNQSLASISAVTAKQICSLTPTKLPTQVHPHTRTRAPIGVHATTHTRTLVSAREHTHTQANMQYATFIEWLLTCALHPSMHHAL
jgi:hypothetical protein